MPKDHEPPILIFHVFWFNYIFNIMKKNLIIICLLFIGYSYSFSQSVKKTIKVEKSLFGNQYIHGQKTLSNFKLIEIMESNELAYEKIASGFTYYSLSKVLGFTSSLLLSLQLKQKIIGKQLNPLCILIGGGLVLISIPFRIIFNKKFEDSVKLYNNAQLKTSFWDNKELKFTINENGAGLKLVF